MISLVRNYLQKNELSPIDAQRRLWEKFKANGAHQWIIDDSNLSRAFSLIFQALPHEATLRFVTTKEIVFIPSQGHLACALGSRTDTDVILVFPDLIKIFHSASYLHAVAVILHEIGHLYLEHNKKVMDILEAQVEADAFAIRCGFGHELQEVLLDSVQSLDTKVRISRITAEILTQEH